MRLLGLKTWALLVTLLFMSSIAASSVDEVTEPTEASGDVQPTAGTSPRVVLVEELTAQWCPPCVSAARALTRVEDEYSKTEIVVVAYHASSDPFYDSSVIGPRVRIYANSTYYLPSVIVDGGGPGNTNALWNIGGNNPDVLYNSYTADIKSRRAQDTNLQITPIGDLTATQAWTSATIYASDDVTETNLYVTIVLYEDNLYYMGSNGNPLHRVVARALWEQPLVISKGQTVTVSHTFSLNPGWDGNKMGFVAFVQTHNKSAGWTYNSYYFYNADVLQATKYRFVNPPVLFVRDDEQTDYREYMETPLTYNGRAFENWNELNPSDTGLSDIRGTPSPAEMEEFGAVLWVSGKDGTIGTTEMTDIADYLNADGGNILVTGQNITTEIDAIDPTWLNDNLHAAKGVDIMGVTYANGIVGDPITDQFNATNLNFVGGSPDTVDPANGGITMLEYLGPTSAAVRADHGTDSRTLLFGMNYFEGTDTELNKRPLIENILLWLDGAGGPTVSVVSPNGGEELSTGDIALIKWHAVDVFIPLDGVDIYYTNSLSSPTWNLVASNQPNDGVYRWQVPSVTTSDCGVRIVVRDADPSTPDGEAISTGPCTIGSPNIGISKTVSDPAPMVYDTITYTITASNTGTTAGYVTVEDHLPFVVTYVSDDGGLSGSSTYYAANHTVVWWVPVPSMSSASVNINVTVDFAARLQRSNYAFFNSTSVGGGSAQSGSDVAMFQIPSFETWSVNLTVGRHLMSIPMLMLDYQVDSVLSSISGCYDYVRTYTGGASDPWIAYEPGRSYNALQMLPHGSAFWINIVTPCMLTVEGARPLGSTLLTLQAGWNLIGFPSYSTTYTIGDMKTSIGQAGIRAEGFDINSPPYNLWRLPDTYVMTAGEGYWVFVPNSGTWTVPA